MLERKDEHRYFLREIKNIYVCLSVWFISCVWLCPYFKSAPALSTKHKAMATQQLKFHQGQQEAVSHE